MHSHTVQQWTFSHHWMVGLLWLDSGQKTSVQSPGRACGRVVHQAQSESNKKRSSTWQRTGNVVFLFSYSAFSEFIFDDDYAIMFSIFYWNFGVARLRKLETKVSLAQTRITSAGLPPLLLEVPNFIIHVRLVTSNIKRTICNIVYAMTSG